MIHFRHAVLACTLALGLSPLQAAAQQQTDGLDNPMVQAVLQVYADEIAANPKNFEAMLKRAEELYKHNQYLRALADVESALAIIPASDSASLLQAYTLRANILQMLGKKEEALADLNRAIPLDSAPYANIYQRANICYELGDYAQAKADYMRLRRLNSRSMEALVGLARVAVKENNLGLANDYINDAVALAPHDSEVYVRRASVRRLLGNNTGAADDLLMAISTDNNATALQRLVELSDEDYPAVVNSLTNAIREAPSVGIFRYIRAMIAQSHYHYPAALDDYQTLLDEGLYDYAGIYSSMAECHLALCQYDDARSEALHAISMTADNAPYYTVLSRVLRVMGHLDEALAAADKALDKQPTLADALRQRALCLASLGKLDEAQTLLGDLLIENPDSPYLYMTRAWIAADLAKERGKALAFYRLMLNLNVAPEEARSLRGFALLALDRREEAIEWIEQLLAQPDSDGYKHFLGACFYDKSGDTDAALTCMTFALQRGFANLFDWTAGTDAGMAPVALRQLPKFHELLTKYDYIFQQAQ